MKGDFTRDTFDRKKHYSRVLMQQGRVQLDADWNEQADLLAYLDRTTRRDVIGHCGGPQGQDAEGNDLAGFRIVLEEGNLLITRGRYYVEGILCENEADVLISAQPHLPDFDLEDLDEETDFLAYLDVWERHLTALDDPGLREVALGGPDTATRVQTVWQVKLAEVPAGSGCGDFGPGWQPPGSESTGRLAARAQQGEEADELCLIPAEAGYRRLENQLYRVEIHTGGPAGEATFVWSRENGAVASLWEAQDGNTLTVSSSGRDSNLGFAAGGWVELVDDTRELNGRPGELVQLVSVEGRELTIQEPGDPDSVNRDRFPLNPKVRRWEGPDGAEVVRVPAENDGWLSLEDGVEIRFDPDGVYQTGDYWLIPARTALGDVLWPLDEATGEPALQRRRGIEHFFCPLAVVSPAGGQRRGLVRVTDGQVGPDLASDFTVSENQREWTFHLVEGVPLPDGSTLNADAMVAVLRENREAIPGFAGARPIDDLTLVLALTEPPGDQQAFLTALSEITIAVLSEEAAVTDCRSLFPSLTGVSGTGPATQPEAGVRITDVLLGLGDGRPLENDSDVSTEELARGLQVLCSAQIDPGAVKNKPVFSVTLEMPFPLNRIDRQLWGELLVGFQPLILAAEVTAQARAILWRPAGSTSEWLQGRLMPVLAEFGLETRVLARLTLKGNFIWTPRRPRRFVDGEAFGEPVPDSDRSGLDLPSGDGRRGGDFEMWFWLVG